MSRGASAGGGQLTYIDAAHQVHATVGLLPDCLDSASAHATVDPFLL